MTPQFFKTQMQELMSVFGVENYPAQRLELIWREVGDLPEGSFAQIVKHFIGNKPIKYPPLLSDFQEEAHRQRKLLASQQTRLAEGAIKSMAHDPRSDSRGLAKVLELFYGADNPKEAFRIALQKNRSN